MKDDSISRQTVLRCIKESRDNTDWGQSEDGDAFLHYTGALYRTVASEECLPSAQPAIIRCGECINHIGNRCIKADHHTSDMSCCMSVFHAERKGAT